MKNNSIIISTGGTGGHIIPAVALAEYFSEKKYSGMVVGDDNVKKYLNGDKIKFQKINSGSSLRKVKSVMNIIKGFLQSLKIVKNIKPDAVIGFGCYTTLPMLMACKIKKVPIFLHEGNAFIGKINRFFSKDCINIFTSFQELYGMDYKYSNKIVFSGSVVRNEVKSYYNDIYKNKSANEKIKILITGGSGGASFFSKEFIKVFLYINKNLKDRLEICHQVKGKNEIDEVKYFYNKENIKSEVKDFFDDLPKKMYDSDLIICRSGIGTISEISFIGRACIMVPSPNVANNHQTYNAKFFERSNACFLLEEKSFVAQNFAKTFEDIINNKLEILAKNIKSMAVLDADEKIYNIINSYINDKNIFK